MNKVALILLAAVLAFGFSGQAMAADGNVSDGLLADMGLASMQTMTDAQGDQIRGKGFAAAWGYSSAHVYGAHSTNGYLAVGHHVAAGANLSIAANKYKIAGAGGFSAAFSY